ncbi:putative spermidine/putrescine transport system permease protein [Thermanaeromonas toyohensis ToBE]|uniref:Putative spermidine/putrescine transport system permease protein n=1 Tax=Thermanaeromonas toyohensis ToBE TaxID=698762 RepID=A0A1W1VYK1_9FIRM|nr:ABC transporter permease [Thermanaeromonas toyohensis]SMB98181.1 putative spermidine/putrescine transport system permease protein [Thermanaeromonas toyohensis ToBE]
MQRRLNQAIFFLLLAFIIIPLVVPVIYSFSLFWQGLWPEGFTLKWYQLILSDPKYKPAAIVSLIVASSAVLLNIFISVPAAYTVTRLKGFLGNFIDTTFQVLPLVIPPLIVGLALLQSFTREPLALTGTVYIVIIAHTLLGFPFMFRSVLASFRTIDERILSEAAASLGASLWQRLWYVVIPNVMPGILSGSLLVFAISMGEFEVTSMVAGFKAQTFPLVLFQQLRNDMRIASAVSAILVYISVASFLLINYISSKIKSST